MSAERIPPLSADERASLRRSYPYEDEPNAVDHAVDYAVQESQPFTKSDVERVARAMHDGFYESAWDDLEDEDHAFYREVARAALLAGSPGRTIAEDAK